MREILFAMSIACSALCSSQIMSGKAYQLPKKTDKYMHDMVYIEGGIFTMHSTNFYNFTERDSFLLTFTVPFRLVVFDFYISDHEVTNAEYREFTNWVIDSIGPQNVLDVDTPRFYKHPTMKVIPEKLLYSYLVDGDTVSIPVYPDTSIWTTEFPYFFYGEPYTDDLYFCHPAYANNPVVGINFDQAMAYCHWRTEQLNNALRQSLGYEPDYRPRFRLPTEGEWEYAAHYWGDRKNMSEERFIFPWEDSKMVDKKGKYRANFGPIRDENGFTIKNFMDDGYTKTSPVRSFLPNSFQLYDMAGNVSEWTMDIPHPHGFEDSTGFKLMVEYDDDFATAFEKTYRILWLEYGRFDSTNVNDSIRIAWFTERLMHDAKVFHNYPDYRLVKGGSWYSAPAYLQCGTREVFPQSKSSCRIGFRMAMTVFKETPK